MARLARFVYLAFAWLFVIGVVTQVFLAGMVVVARKIGWDYHASLGHMLGFPFLFMLVSMYVGGLPGSVKKMTWVLYPDLRRVHRSAGYGLLDTQSCHDR